MSTSDLRHWFSFPSWNTIFVWICRTSQKMAIVHHYFTRILHCYSLWIAATQFVSSILHMCSEHPPRKFRVPCIGNVYHQWDKRATGWMWFSEGKSSVNYRGWFLCPNVSHHPTKNGIFHLQQIFVLVMWNKSPKRDINPNPWLAHATRITCSDWTESHCSNSERLSNLAPPTKIKQAMHEQPFELYDPVSSIEVLSCHVPNCPRDPSI